MKKTIQVVLVLAALCAPAAFGCDQMCRNDECVTMGYVTGMACHQVGAACFEDQAYGCWLAESDSVTAPAGALSLVLVDQPAMCTATQ